MILGNLRYNIIVKALVTTRDAANGSSIDSYIPKFNLKAGIKSGSGTRKIDNNEVFNTATTTFITHYRSIVDSDRIEFGGCKYKIMSIGEIGWKEGLEITTEKINE